MRRQKRNKQMYAIAYFTWNGTFNESKPKHGVIENLRLATGALAFWDGHYGPSDCVMLIPHDMEATVVA